MAETKNILVTGAGALLGQGMLRALRTVSGHSIKIYTADPDHRASGHWLGDHALIIPMAKDPEFMSVIESIIERFDIDMVLVGTDVELMKFSQDRAALEEKYGCHIIVSPESTIEIGNNKWSTVNFLKENSLDFPDSALSNNKDEMLSLKERAGLPLFVKPTVGARSIGARKVEDEQDLLQIEDTAGDNIIQEYLPAEEGEFTAGTMVFNDEIIYVIILRRDLRDGNTYRAYSVMDNSLQASLKEVISNLDIYGPCNFQFRIRNNKPVIFEINSRFSGTTPLRTFFGINELQVLMDYLFSNKTVFNFELKEGAVLRTFSDIFVESGELDQLKENGELKGPSSTYYPYKNS